MGEEKKISFWEKIIISIKDFDKYPYLATLKAKNTIMYIIALVSILTFVVSSLSMYKISEKIDGFYKYIQDKIIDISYKEGTLEIVSKDNKPIVIEKENSIFNKIIIDTLDIDAEKEHQYMDEIQKTANGILILKDKVVVKATTTKATVSYSYKELLQGYNIQEFDKEYILSRFSGNNIVKVYILIFVMIYLSLFTTYFIDVLINIILLAGLGYFTAILLRLRLRYSAMCNIAAYSLTLPILLNTIYAVVQAFTGFEIKYFDIMYICVAYIYIVTTILLIKLDVIKKGRELAKIVEEQAVVREELKRKEEEERKKEEQKKEEEKRKQKEEKEKDEKKDKEKQEDGGGISSEPQGNNV